MRFVDPDLDEQFSRLGFVVVPLLSEPAVTGLRAHAQAWLVANGDGGPFRVSIESGSLADRRRLSDEITAAVLPRVQTRLADAAAIGGAFLAKLPDPAGSIDVHQDWTSVDEQRACSMNVWCALQDTDVSSGALQVLPGSHLWFDAARSPTIPSVSLPIGDLAPYLEPLPVRSGDAVFYDHRLFHGSWPNRSGAIRLVAQLGVAPSSEPLVMAAQPSSGPAELKPATRDDFLRGLDGTSAGAPLATTGPAISASAVVERARAELGTTTAPRRVRS